MPVESPEEMEEAARVIKRWGPDVVITGGHLERGCMDLLYDGKEFYRYYGSRIDTQHTHGTGCVFSTALAVFVAETGDMVTATKMARDFTRRAIRKGYACGRGAGPVQSALGPEWKRIGEEFPKDETAPRM